MFTHIRLILAVACVYGLLASAEEPLTIPSGAGRVAFKDGTTQLDLYTFRPAKFDAKRGPIVLVFHGVNRNAEEYRDWAKTIADNLGAIVAVPHFTKEQFPTSAYQFGNLLKSGTANPPSEWTWSLIPKIADAIRHSAARADTPFYLIGHSAGGQFTSRLSGFVDTNAIRIVAANPGTHLFPTRDMKYPLGFGGLPEELSNDDAIRRYLARPLTFYLGTADTVADKNLDVSEAAMKQGANRYERGTNAFAAGKTLAKKHGWTFNWRLIEADGVGHVAEKMFAHPNCRTALLGEKK